MASVVGVISRLRSEQSEDQVDEMKRFKNILYVAEPAQEQRAALARAVSHRQILAAFDFDPWRAEQDADALNRQIPSLASSLALPDFADLYLVHCWEHISEQVMRLWTDTSDAASIANAVQTEQMRHQEGVSRLTHQLRDWIGEEACDYLAPRIHLLHGQAREIIPELARTQHFDLVVMGTLGRAGLPGLLIGNTAEAILGQLECALLAVKPPGFVSPVTLTD